MFEYKIKKGITEKRGDREEENIAKYKLGWRAR